jgi:membrane protein implicated in regulation of membrane protease activity
MIFAFIACGVWALLLWTSLAWWIKFVVFPIVVIALYFVFVNVVMNLMRIGHPHSFKHIFRK